MDRNLSNNNSKIRILHLNVLDYAECGRKKNTTKILTRKFKFAHGGFMKIFWAVPTMIYVVY